MPAPLAAKLLDAAVNLGPRPAIDCLQRALNAKGCTLAEDGILGPATIAAAQSVPPDVALAALRDANSS